MAQTCNIEIIIAGDYYPQGKFKYSEKISEIIKNSDYSIANYESPISIVGHKKIDKCGPNLSSTIQDLFALKDMGFRCVTLANNHTLDYGADGLTHTIEEIEEAGLDHVGAGKDLHSAQQPLIINISGNKIGIINCCEHEFSIAEDNMPGTNPLDPVQQYYQIQECRKSCDYLIMIVHGGSELFNLPTIRMQETYRFFIDNGVDAVINHHQHCYSGYEIYKNRPIFYGIGNFIFPKVSNNLPDSWHEGYLVKLNLSEAGVNFDLVPFTQCKDVNGIRLLDDKGVQQFKESITKLNGLITDKTALESEISEWRNINAHYYKSALCPYSNRIFRFLWHRGIIPSGITKSKINRLINYIDCESHRERFLEMLKSEAK